MKKIFVNEVGPRGGLQNIDIILNVDQRFQLIESLERAGINSLEVGSFVSPKAVPAMHKTDWIFYLTILILLLMSFLIKMDFWFQIEIGEKW